VLKINPYLNFEGTTEEAFNFYKSVFGGEFVALQRFSNVPGMDKLSAEDGKKLMHVSLMIGDNTLMGTDTLAAMGHTVTMGTNISLSLHPESKEEADRLFAALQQGGSVVQPMEDASWGDYFGMLKDKFGITWMVNYTPTK
jgi:PhnB protein